jgi:hypothetical protein
MPCSSSPAAGCCTVSACGLCCAVAGGPLLVCDMMRPPVYWHQSPPPAGEHCRHQRCQSQPFHPGPQLSVWWQCLASPETSPSAGSAVPLKVHFAQQWHQHLTLRLCWFHLSYCFCCCCWCCWHCWCWHCCCCWCWCWCWCWHCC